jgi:hypothetical protein
MTSLSPIKSNGSLLLNRTKGSTYGKQVCWSSRHSFLISQRDGGSNRANGAQVLYSEAVIRPLQYLRSIIKYCE